MSTSSYNLNPVLPRPVPATINVTRSVTSNSGKTFPIKGYVAKGFEPVLKSFEDNFRTDKELGAGVTTYRKHLSERGAPEDACF